MFRAIITLIGRLLRATAPPPSRAAGSRADAPVGTSPHLDLNQVQDLVGKVTAMTSAVTHDVGQHHASLQAINEELTAVAQNDPTAVAAIVCKLLMANRDLHQRLESAEQSLQDHSQQLKSAMASARTDALTGLTNRRALDERLAHCVADLQRHNRPSAILMLDIDRFKQFNDTFGHLAGDQALTHTAATLRDKARQSDVVARYGGEEFVVVFTGATSGSVRERAEQLRTAIAGRTLQVADCEFQITASAGLAQLAPGDSIADWLKRADQALYAAKGAGRDCAFEMIGNRLEKITPSAAALAPPPRAETRAVENLATRPLAESAAELAPEAFADTSFVQNIARRIAEWRRGGATLTVVLARLDDALRAPANGLADPDRPVIRNALQVARLCLREMDVITRWRHDGLAFLLPSTPAADAKNVARRLRAALAASSTDGATRLSVSMGLAEGIEGNDAKRVLERAWLALEAARAAGSGNIYIHDGIKAAGLRFAATR